MQKDKLSHFGNSSETVLCGPVGSDAWFSSLPELTTCPLCRARLALQQIVENETSAALLRWAQWALMPVEQIWRVA